MADTPFPSFATSASPLAGEFAVGYATNVSGGERRWLWSDVRTLMQANLGTAAFQPTSAFEPAITAGTTAQYWRGDKTWQTLNSTAVGLGNVENTALSTWAGSSNLTTLGNITAKILIDQASGDTYATSGLLLRNSGGGPDTWNIIIGSTQTLSFGYAVAWTVPGDFTTYLTLNRNGILTTVNTTDATTTADGAVRFAGGLSVAKSIVGVGIKGTTFNGNTLTAGTWILTGAAAKTLTFSNTLTLAGTDATTMTFPATSTTLGGLGIAQTWSAVNTFTPQVILTGGLSLPGGATITGASGAITFTASGTNQGFSFVPVGSGTAIFTQITGVGGVVIDSPTLNSNITFRSNTVSNCLIGAAAATNGISTGSIAGELVLRGVTSGISFNADNGTSIAGRFVASTGQFLLLKNISSTTTGTGTLVVTGGVGISQNVFIGGTLSATGHVTLEAITSTGATGTGKLVFDTGPTFSAPILGTPASGTVTNLTGTASININGTVGATTPSTVAATQLTVSGGSFAAARLYFDATLGVVLVGKAGASTDFAIYNPGGTLAYMQVGTGTVNCDFSGNITIASGKDLKLGRARAVGAAAQGGTITILDSAGATVTLLTT